MVFSENAFSGKDVRSSSSGSKIPFLNTLNPAKWGRTERSERQATMKVTSFLVTLSE